MTYLNIKTMKIRLDALLKMKRGKMSNFWIQHLFRFQMSLNWMFHKKLRVRKPNLRHLNMRITYGDKSSLKLKSILTYDKKKQSSCGFYLTNS